MEIKIGSDIMQLKKFQKAFKRCSEKFERDIFCESELQNPNLIHSAGLFAAKETNATI